MTGRYERPAVKHRTGKGLDLLVRFRADARRYASSRMKFLSRGSKCLCMASGL